MSIHDGFQELAAAALDFELTETERAELDGHLAGCDACRRTVAGYKNDAVALLAVPIPRLTPERATAVLERVLRPPRRASPMRLLAVAALLTVVGGGVIAAGMGISRLVQDPTLAVVPTPNPFPSLESSAPPSASTDPSAAPTSETPSPPPDTTVGSLGIRGSAADTGIRIRMAPTSDGGLYVSVPVKKGTVLTLLDSSGASHDGWPVTLAGAASCESVLVVEDGSVRLVCTMMSGDDGLPAPIQAYAFDRAGRSLSGWPVVLADHDAEAYVDARVIGDKVAVFAMAPFVAPDVQNEPRGRYFVMVIAVDGTVRNGFKYNPSETSLEQIAFGPDGRAYSVISVSDDDPFLPTWHAQLYPWGYDTAGFEPNTVMLQGIASRPAFDGSGRIWMVVATEPGGPARLEAYDQQGLEAIDGPFDLGFAALSRCIGAEGTCLEPASPLVGSDGTSFVFGGDPTNIMAVAVPTSGGTLPGWPYRSDRGYQAIDPCPAGAACDAVTLAAPALGPDNTLYLIQAAADDIEGGSLVAVGADGRVVDGWPVGLKRKGAAFWSVVVGADGTVYALAVEPEADRGSSATIVAMRPDSTVRYRTTVIDP